MRACAPEPKEMQAVAGLREDARAAKCKCTQHGTLTLTGRWARALGYKGARVRRGLSSLFPLPFPDLSLPGCRVKISKSDQAQTLSEATAVRGRKQKPESACNSTESGGVASFLLGVQRTCVSPHPGPPCLRHSTPLNTTREHSIPLNTTQHHSTSLNTVLRVNHSLHRYRHRHRYRSVLLAPCSGAPSLLACQSL